MPRYYFHLTDGKQVLNNHKGIDLSGNAAAREGCCECPLSGVKQTCHFALQMSAFDPKRTW